MKARIRIGYKDPGQISDTIENIFQTSEALTTADVPTCGRGLKKDEKKSEFKTIQERQGMCSWIMPKMNSVDPAKIVYLKIRWKDKQMLDRATDFFDYVAPVYAEAYKFSNVFYSASPTGMDVMYESERPLWLAQLWVSWNMFLNRTEHTSLR